LAAPLAEHFSAWEKNAPQAGSPTDWYLIRVIQTIRESWGWTGLSPAAVIASNLFGNLIVRAEDDVFWRICPEDLSCKVVASDQNAFQLLWRSDDFQNDWQMIRLVGRAINLFGSLTDDRCYCLKLAAPLGGRYEAQNLGTITQKEVIAASGNIAEQIRNHPDGATIGIKIVS
jgi:hypothetical protein